MTLASIIAAVVGTLSLAGALTAWPFVSLQRWRNSFQCGNFVFRRDLALGNFAFEILADGFERAIKEALLHVAQRHLIATARENMGNTVAHLPGADHAHAGNLRLFRQQHATGGHRLDFDVHSGALQFSCQLG